MTEPAFVVPRDDPKPGVFTVPRDVIEGVGLGANRFAASLGELLGYLPGLGGLQDRAAQARAEIAAREQNASTATRAGSIAGQVAGEGAITLAGGGLLSAGLRTMAPRAAARLAPRVAAANANRATRASTGAANALRQSAPFVPVDAALGAAGSPESPVAGAGQYVAGGVLGAGLLGGFGGLLSRSPAARALAKSVAPSTPNPHGPAARNLSHVADPAPNVAPGPVAAPPAASAFSGPINPDDFVNVSKFALDDAGADRLRAAVVDAVQTHGFAPKQVVTHAQLRAAASEIGIEQVARTAHADLSAAEMLAIRNIVKENVERLPILYAQRATLEGAERAALDEVITSLERSNNALLGKFTQQRSTFGRDLNSLKLEARSSMEPTIWLERAKKAAGNADIPLSMQQKIIDFALAKDGVGLARTIAEMRAPLSVFSLEGVATLRKAGLLLSIPTHLRNALGNATMGLLEIAKDAPATAADALVGVFTGVRTKSFAPVQSLRASGRGFVEGISEGAGVMKHGMDREALAKLELRETKFANKWFDRYQRTVFRSMSAADKPFKRAAFQRSFAEQIRLGRSEADAEIAAQDAMRAVFQNESVLGKALTGIKEPFGVAGDIAIPFVRTPGAVAGSALEYSVGTLASPSDLARVWKASANGDSQALLQAQKQLVERFGRNATGALAVAVGYELASRGLMTGSSPESKAERDQQGLAGKLAGAIRVGDRWLGVSSIAPLANLLVLGADIHERSNDPELSPLDVAQAAVAGVGQQSVDLSSMRGVKDALQVVSSPKQAGRYLRNTAGSFIPTAVAQAGRTFDDKVREPKTLLQSLATRVPIASRSVPARIDQFGREVERDKTSRVTSLLDPFSSRPVDNDATVKEMERVGANITRLAKRADESDEDFHARSKEVGGLVKQAIDKVIASAPYRAADRAAQAKMIEDASRNTRAKHTRARKRYSAGRESMTQAGLRMLESK